MTSHKWMIGLGITSHCNMSCSFCYSKYRRTNNDLPLNKWLNFFDKNHKEIRDINFGTGENTISADWYILIEYIRKKYPKIKQAITTNGSLSMMIKKNRAYGNIIAKAIDEIDVSLDFGDEKKHINFRGNSNAYKWAIDTLRFCRDHKIQSTIVVMGIEDTLKIENLEKIFKIAKKYGALIRFNLYRPVNKLCTLKPPKIKAIILALDWINENHIICSLSDPLFSSILTDSDINPDSSGINSMRILPDGGIYPSTYLINEEFKSYNITDKDVLQKINSSNIFTKIRKSSLPKDCESCPNRNRCKGGAVDRRYLWYGTLEKRDPYCPKNFDLPLKLRKYKTDKSFSSIHDGYLPTLFFKPK